MLGSGCLLPLPRKSLLSCPWQLSPFIEPSMSDNAC